MRGWSVLTSWSLGEGEVAKQMWSRGERYGSAEDWKSLKEVMKLSELE